MKHKAALLLIYLYSITLNAQGKGWSAGADGFLGWSKFTRADAPSKYINQLAYQVGGAGQYNTKRRVAFRVGLYYSHSRGGYKGQTPSIPFPGLPAIEGDKYEVKYIYSDLVLPLDIIIDFRKQPDEGLYILFGPALDIGLRRQYQRTEYPSGIPQTNGLQDVADYRKFDLLGALGFGYAYRLGSGYSVFLQPTLRTNIPGNVIDFLAQEKGGDPGNTTFYWYGFCFGAMRRF